MHALFIGILTEDFDSLEINMSIKIAVELKI